MESKVTIDELAGMVKRGFDGMDTEFKGVKKEFKSIGERFDVIDEKLDRIENYILKKHEREIEHLKLRMQNLEDMLAMPTHK